MFNSSDCVGRQAFAGRGQAHIDALAPDIVDEGTHIADVESGRNLVLAQGLARQGFGQAVSLGVHVLLLVVPFGGVGTALNLFSQLVLNSAYCVPLVTASVFGLVSADTVTVFQVVLALFDRVVCHCQFPWI